MTDSWPPVTLVAAVARNRVIGVDGRLPWSIPGDMRHFRAVTLGGAVIMGRLTYESIGRALAGRKNVVLTRDPTYRARDVDVATSIDEGLAVAGSSEEGIRCGVFGIGGSGVYEQLLETATRIELTLVDAAPAGDTQFPLLRPHAWSCRAHEHHDGEPGYSFHSLERIDSVSDHTPECIRILAGNDASAGQWDPQDQVVRL